MSARRATSRPRRAPHGQHFLADPNLLELVVREARLDPADVVLEVGGGEGALSRLLAERVARVHVVELDERLRPALEAATADFANVELHWADAMKVDLRGLRPLPVKMVSNLPYSIATPLILRTISEAPELSDWTLMVQTEIADRLAAAPGSRVYGAPSALVQLACRVELIRRVDPAVFKPRPRVGSALIRLSRHGDAAGADLAGLVHAAFAHRRKTLAGSLELAGTWTRGEAREALERSGLRVDARAEALAPEDFVRLAQSLGAEPAAGESGS